MSNKLPITIVTGCLGSGKTTLLSKLLQKESLKRTVVLVNEFGKIGLDHHLLKQVEEQTTLLSGGCVCCSKRDDLEKELITLLNNSQKKDDDSFDRVIIETTGLADPAPIMFTVLSNPLLQHHFYIDCVVTTVDGVNGLLHLEKQQESVKQIIASDRVIITKLDISERHKVNSIRNQVLELNPSIEIVEQASENISAELIQNGNRVVNKSKVMKTALEKTTKTTTQSLSISFDHPLDWSAFGIWLSMLLHVRGEDVLRVKGLLDVGEKGPIVLNGVQHIIHPPEHLKEWPEDEKLSHLVFIVRDINPEEILNSLKQFQNFLGSDVHQLELVEQL